MTHPIPVRRMGACVWLTGLSSAGKSTTAWELEQALLKRGERVVVLDGDRVRAALSKDLGYSKEDRHTNIMRVAAIAREEAQRGACVICALISPYRASRDQARRIVGCERFFEVLVDAPLAVCEARDPKGLYRKARAGQLSCFTGIDDPYERPLNPDLLIDTVSTSVEKNVSSILRLLATNGFLSMTA